MKVIFIPGNGGGSPKDNWFPYLKNELEKLGVNVVASEFPDSYLARESYWVPFLKDNLKADEQTILVGHSSGAIAAMRLAETDRLLGSVLVGAYHTDMGMTTEKQSGYFDRPWDWEAIVNNQQWIIQFASENDPWIPIEEARFVHDQLKT
ncbi:MAG TPA: alpha/beta fold hydrolase, partial [Parachlamydiaceae bacterium]|nr:alpha/beta fold hydrolase [Parachlamydiaceae bacterium]